MSEKKSAGWGEIIRDSLPIVGVVILMVAFMALLFQVSASPDREAEYQRCLGDAYMVRNLLEASLDLDMPTAEERDVIVAAMAHFDRSCQP